MASIPAHVAWEPRVRVAPAGRDILGPVSDAHGDHDTATRRPTTLRVHVDPLPLPVGEREDDAYSDVVVVIDVLRTSTVVPILFERGIDAVRLSPGLRLARRAAAASNDLLIGERRGLPPEGFNLGNSPVSLDSQDLGGRRAVMVSENAPAALPHVAGARTVLLASLVNASAATALAAERATARIDLVCCGFRAAADLDDLATAGLLADLLLRERPEATPSGATELARNLLRVGADPLALLWNSSAGRHLRELGLERDLGVAADVDRSSVVPVMGPPEQVDDGTLYPFHAATGA